MKNKLEKNVDFTVWEKIKRSRESYILLAPFMLIFALLTILPMLSAIGLSFTSFNMLEIPRFIGLQNYQRMLLDDPIFFKVVKNTIVFAFITGSISYILSFLFAWLINETGRALRTVLTVLFYIPVLAGNIYFVWAFLFSSDSYGVVNGFLIQMNIIKEPIGWLIDQNMIMPSLVVVQLWMSLGTGFLAFIAGFQSMDRSLFEAGAIDGVRNRSQELWYITIPSMSNQLLFSAVMQIAASFGVSTVIVFLAGFPTTQYSADTVVTYIMDIGTTRFEMGYACTIAVFLFALMFLTNFIITGALRKFSTD
ncbi:MAG: sugar ABC transporter permease [Oscillospiraceae bacterium]|nr:sugar ABC transporter permease [Oscillospiraceae bacterium]